jgi:hypothetical protein
MSSTRHSRVTTPIVTPLGKSLNHCGDAGGRCMGLLTGRPDTRFTAPAHDPLVREPTRREDHLCVGGGPAVWQPGLVL